jgi:hypothetical protein
MKTITIIGHYPLKVTKELDQNAPGDRRQTVTIEGEFRSPSDGYHTFDELYEHRFVLFIALCKALIDVDPDLTDNEHHEIWRSRLHSDGSSYDGWFILGIGKETQITYHLPLSKWDETDFAETLEKAPEFDGHTSQDVIERLSRL